MAEERGRMPKNKSKSSSGRAKRDRATPDSAVITDHSESSNLLLHHLPSSNTTSDTQLSSPPSPPQTPTCPVLQHNTTSDTQLPSPPPPPQTPSFPSLVLRPRSQPATEPRQAARRPLRPTGSLPSLPARLPAGNSSTRTSCRTRRTQRLPPTPGLTGSLFSK